MGFVRLTTNIAEAVSGDEHYSVSEHGLRYLQDLVNTLVTASVAFKSGRPFQLSSEFEHSSVTALSDVKQDGESLGDVLSQFVTEILPRSLNFGSPAFLAHPDCGNSMAGVLGDIATAFLQQNLVTYEYSALATRMEFELLRQLRDVVGFAPANVADSGVADVGGVFLFGGSGGNLGGLMAARESLNARLRSQGRILNPRKARVIANSPYTHYSLRRSLFILGLGSRDLTPEQCMEMGVSAECLLPVATKGFRIDPDDLERTIEASLKRDEDIVCIFAVAGDSRIMEFDDLQAITAIARKYNIWVHVDAAQGGQCLFSPRRRHLLKGIEETDSVSLDPHKVLMLPYNLGVLLLREPKNMELVSSGASVIRLGKGSFGTYTPAVGSRGFNSLKLWFMLKHWGWEKLAHEIDRRHELAKDTHALLNNYDELIPIHPAPTHNAVGFLFKPANLNLDVPALNRLNSDIHRSICAEGKFFIHMMAAQDAYGAISDDKAEITHLRMMFGNPLSSFTIVKKCLDEVVTIGRRLVANGLQSEALTWKDHDR